MPSIVLYLIKCSIGLSIVWLFYQLLLRRLTFYSMNRWYLMGYAALSFLLPLIHIVLPAEEEIAGNIQVIRYIPVIRAQPSVGPTAPGRAYTGWDMLLAVLALGALLLLVRLLIRYLSLRRIQKRALLIGDGHLTIYHVNEPITPFSFGKAIYLNPRLHSEKECEEIILHEYVHVRQRHTVDILAGEALCILSWFNPFSWLIRHSIRQNLEFIADRQVLASGLDRKAYQYHLLKVVGESRYRLANNFNFSSLKKRIIMMNKSRSAKLHLVKFLFIVPLLGVLLVAFRDRVENGLRGNIFHESAAAPDRTESAREVATVRTVDADTLGRPKKDTLHGPMGVMHSLGDSTKPMYVLDERETDKPSMNMLNPADISFIDVLKNDSKTASFGPRAAAGVVVIYSKAYLPHKKNVITLKDGKKVKYVPHEIMPGRDSLPAPIKDTLQKQDLGLAEASAIKVARDVADTSPFKAVRESLIIVDGKACSYEEVQKIDVNQIESINILHNKSAEAIYGPKASKGVMLITMKKGLAPKQQTFSVTTDKEGTTSVTADSIRLESNKKP